MSYDIFNQIRVDYKREFYLMLGMQEPHKELRRNQNISSYRQTQSRKVYALLISGFSAIFKKHLGLTQHA